jgi:hypothetical protein
LRRPGRLTALVDALRRLGPATTLLYLVGLVLSRLSRGRIRTFGYRLVAQPVATVPLLGGRSPGGLSIRRVFPGDPIVAQFPRPREVVAGRFADGAVCFAAESGGRFAGFIWLNLASYEDDEVRCLYVPVPQASTAWDFDVFVAPPFRLGRAFAALWDAANAYLREQGVEWTFSRISAFNLNSMRAHARMGVQRVGSAVFIRFGRTQLAAFSVAPFVHASLGADSRPVLHLRGPTQASDRRA